MGEFIIAVLIVSLLWVMWDVVKLILGERYREEQMMEACEPGRERMGRYAESFVQLADTFRSMPDRKECFSDEDVSEIFEEVRRKVCSFCPGWEYCWEKNCAGTYREAYELLHIIEEQGDADGGENSSFMEICSCGTSFLQALRESFRIARVNLMWSNRLLENRRAVAEQLYETAAIMESAADLTYEVRPVDAGLEKQMYVRLRMHGIILREMWDTKRDGDRLELFLTMRTARKGRCVSTREIAGVVSDVCSRRMLPDRDSRTIINREYSTVLFYAEPDFMMLNGVAKVTKDGELVSGDNFSMFRRENGQMIMSLSDGMGSGADACRESETVIELLEQFLHAGFRKETAVHMIHSTMMLQNNNRMFSTVDLCMVDLYTAECELLKIGASTTFFKKKEWVEAVSSTSLPMGFLQTLDYESARKKLDPGDFVIMVSDGVLDALPHQQAEEILKDIIWQSDTDNAQEMAKAILSRVLLYQKCKAKDDMTVLVGGLWRSK